MAATLLSGVLACLSKESAYCLPLLAACLSLFFEGMERCRMLLVSLWLGLICSATFGYRSWYLQGIGGYRTASGSAMVLNWHGASTAQALLLRLWALLFVPVNWSGKPEIWLRFAAMFLFLLTAMTGWRTQVRANYLRAALLLTFFAAIPVFPLLLIGWDLAGARVLYLPSAGICLFWAATFSSPVRREVLAGLACIVMFQLAALLHNEFIWRGEAGLARQACLDAGDLLRRDSKVHIHAIDLPRTRNGVFFLGNGFAECAALASGDESNATRLDLGAAPGGFRAGDLVVEWSEGDERLKVRK